MERQFDLAISLEVAEHLDSKYASSFVAALLKSSPVVCFSAAIPFQDGVNHVNEQWPDYWARLFASHDYLAIDCIREKIWDNEKVELWYAQNIIVFAEKKEVAKKIKVTGSVRSHEDLPAFNRTPEAVRDAIFNRSKGTIAFATQSYN